MFVPLVSLAFAVDEALRSATGAVRICLWRWTISMVATTFDGDFSQLQMLLVLMFSSMSSNLQHVPGCAACHHTILCSEALVLIFFVLMDDSLLVFGALHCRTNLATVAISDASTLCKPAFSTTSGRSNFTSFEQRSTLCCSTSSRSLFPLDSANLCAPPFCIRGSHNSFPPGK
jgi:hypothetical protein